MYFFQPFRCKKSNEITKSGSICLFQKLDSPGAPKPTLGPKTPLKYPRRAEIGINASHAVQLTSFGPKKPDSNRSPQRSVPFTWNHPLVDHISSPAVKISIAEAMAFGEPRSEEYCFGNPYIKSQLAAFVERMLARKSKQVCKKFSLFHRVAIYLFLKSPPKPLFICILLDLLFPGRESAACSSSTNWAAACSSSTNWAAFEEAQILHP